MAIRPFLAMTAAEISSNYPLPDRIGWMACHFSPYSVGLSNRPKKLSAGSLLIVNDVIPIHGHDPEVIAAQLLDTAEQFGCCGILLDFQRPNNPEAEQMAAYLSEALPFPVSVSDLYAGSLCCPVFLPPLPHHVPLKDWIKPWHCREIWLELAMNAEEILITDSGAVLTPLPHSFTGNGHMDNALHCHYRVELLEHSARFTIWRTKQDISALLEEADSLGITAAVGLYQEFRQMQKPPVGTTGGLEHKIKRDV